MSGQPVCTCEGSAKFMRLDDEVTRLTRALAAVQASNVALREALGHALTCRECAEGGGCDWVRAALATPSDDAALREFVQRHANALSCPGSIVDHGARQAWERGRRDVVDAVLKGTP